MDDMTLTPDLAVAAVPLLRSLGLKDEAEIARLWTFGVPRDDRCEYVASV